MYFSFKFSLFLIILVSISNCEECRCKQSETTTIAPKTATPGNQNSPSVESVVKNTDLAPRSDPATLEENGETVAIAKPTSDLSEIVKPPLTPYNVLTAVLPAFASLPRAWRPYAAIGTTLSYLAVNYYPNILSTVGVAAPTGRSSSISYDNTWGTMLNQITTTLNTLPEKSFEMLNIQGKACKAKFVCEVGQKIGDRLPRLESFVKRFGTIYPIGQYFGAVLKGVRHDNCTELYNSCRESHLSNLQQILLAVY